MIATLVASLLLGSPAFADTCQNLDKCNVEAESNPSVSWAEGVSANFPTVSGSVATVIVNSISVFKPNFDGDLVEVGWRLKAGANRFEPFAVSVYNAIYTAYAAPRPAGNFTFQYTVRYRSSVQCFDLVPCFEATAVSGGTTYMDFQMDNPGFSAGGAITNAERHDSTDTFSATPTFTGLQRLSSSAWSFWPAAQCFADSDPNYKNNYFIGPVAVTVTAGSATC